MSKDVLSVRTEPALSADRADHRLAWCIAVLVLVPALCARLGWLRWMEYSGDEYYFLVRAFRALQEGIGYGYPTSAGVRVPPFFVYLVSVPLLFTHDPVLVASFIAVLNLVGLALLYLFARELLDSRSAILVTLLMATSPWAIMFSRKIWNLDAIFPLIVAMHLALFSNLREYRRWKVLLAFALFGAASQIHPSVWLLFVPLVLLHTLLRARLQAIDLLLGLGVIALLYAPYIGYLLSTDFDNLRYVWNLGTKSGGTRAPLADLLYWHASRPIEIAGGANLPALLGMGARPGFLEQPAAVVGLLTGRVLFVAMALAALVALGWSVVRVPRALSNASLSPTERYLVFFSMVLVFAISAGAALGMVPNQHYYTFLYPIVPVMFVWALERALRWIHAPAWSSIAIVGLICAANLVFMLSFFSFLGADPEIQRGSVPVYYAPKAARCERELAEAFDDVLNGTERRRAKQARLERRFEASSESLLSIDTLHNDPPVTPFGQIRIQPTREGLVVRGGTPVDMAALPEFQMPKDKSAILRLDLSSPDEAILLVFFQTVSDPSYSHRRVRDALVRRGRSTVFIELDAREITRSLHLRLEVFRYVIHALEIRSVER
jgi:hypothetical protein